MKKTLGWVLGAVVAFSLVGALGDEGTANRPVATATAGSETATSAGEPSSRADPSVTPTPVLAPSPKPKRKLPPATTDEPIARAEPRTALALLATLTVKGRAPRTGYDRALFGQVWADTDRNGCDTRNDILARDLTGVSFKAGTRNCVVLTGQLAEPYTGRTVTFTKQDANAVQIDHVVALSDAWQKGAQPWPAGKRLAFANDPLNLLAVDGPANRAKSDGDAASWLPPNKAYRCSMVARQVAVKAKYGLWAVPAERDAIARVLSSCPKQVAPTGGNPTLAPVAAAESRATRTAAPPQPAAGTAREYANCTELRQDYRGGVARAGAVNQGGRTTHQPLYDSALYNANSKSDRDKDGIACER